MDGDIIFNTSSIHCALCFCGWFYCHFSLQLFSVIPRHYLPHIKSPCWYEEFSANLTVNPYKWNLFLLIHPSLKDVFQNLWENFDQHLHSVGDKKYRLRCLPYFYIIGQPKCGTTDLYRRLKQHPALRFNLYKEYHWWPSLHYGKWSGSWCSVLGCFYLHDASVICHPTVSVRRVTAF